MTNIVVALVVMCILATMFFLIDPKERVTHKSLLSYKKKPYFFSISERKFYDVLKEVAYDLNLELFAKVRLADIIFSDGKTGNWMVSWNKIKSKHIDFLLCDKLNYEPMIGIELDDSSHLRSDRLNRDIFENEALEQVGLKLIRFKPQQSYLKEEIKTRIAS